MKIYRIASVSEYGKQISPNQILEYIFGKNGYKMFFGLITPQGELYKCAFEGHYGLVRELEGVGNKWIDKNNISMLEPQNINWYKLGYIRVGWKQGGYGVEFDGNPDSMAKNSLLMMEISNILKRID